MKEHFVKEEDQVCYDCSMVLPKKGWISEFVLDFHYKVIDCNKCGKKHRIKVNFEGSGHDDGFTPGLNIEKLIEKNSKKVS